MISYSYHHPRSSHLPPPHPSVPPPSYAATTRGNSDVTILLSCPSLPSCWWCLKLYTMVVGGMGVVMTSLWVVGHTYVLIQTEDKDLRIHRYGVLIFVHITSLSCKSEVA